jgi:hypothetical protein
MSIQQKVKAIEQLFNGLQKEINTFQLATKLHCNSGCGKCCNKADIDASPLEFLPWAYHTFLNGDASQTLDKLEQEESANCILYRPLSVHQQNSGQCSNYKYRGLICRLFGYGAGRDKVNKLRLATCKIIKEEQYKDFENAQIAISNGLYVPIFSDYYMQLNRIDFRMGNQILPINEAMKSALETVLHYYAYRPYPKAFKNIA